MRLSGRVDPLTLYRLHTLAESTQRLSSEMKALHPEIPWEDIAGFRNRMVHGYLGVNLDIVWDSVGRRRPSGRPVGLISLRRPFWG